MIEKSIHSSPRQRSPGFGCGLVNAALSLQCKATVLVVVLMLTVVGAVSGYLLRSSVKLARGHQDEHLVQLASMLGKAAAATLAAGEREALATLAEKAANGTPLLYVVFSDVEGRNLAAGEHRSVAVLSRLARDAVDRPPVLGIPMFHRRTQDGPGLLDITYPVSHRVSDNGPSGSPSTRLLGYVRTGMQANRWYQALSGKLDILIGVTILAAVIAIPLGFLLIRRIISPLEGLAEVMGEFSEGKLDIRCPVRRRDEIGRLALAFNRMADQHQRTHERIVHLNVKLEDRVAERTKQLNELASREPLTGLYNRRHFNEVLERGFSEARRYQTDLSCMMLDLDDFKAVNDDCGHHVGDEVLILTARTILAQLRSSDVAARYGGDEFIVLLPQTGAHHARILGERIGERFSREAARLVNGRRLTASMGIASLASMDAPTPAALVQAADRALYQAKAAGKSCIMVAEAAPDPTPR